MDRTHVRFWIQVLVGAQHQQNFNRALVERDTIGQAKGILMERYKLDAAAAFGVLVRTSQQSNRKLSDIAHLIAYTGVDPATPTVLTRP